MNEIVVIEDKFTRCPQCRSFSVKVTTDLDSKERLKKVFIPVTAYLCNNCSYRYVEFGTFSTTLKKMVASWTGRIRSAIGKMERKWLLAVVPLALVVIITALVIFLPTIGSGDEPPPVKKDPVPIVEKQPEKSIEQKQEEKVEQIPENKPEQKPEEVPPINPEQTIEKKPEQLPEQKPEQLPEQKPEQVPAKSEPQITGDIVLGNSNRFGVNWKTVVKGVQIIRLSNGPLKKAGIRLGDILAEVEGQPIRNGNYLLKIRNEIFMGKRPGTVVKVLRNNGTYYFRLVKVSGTKIINPESKAAKQPVSETRVIKVFSRNSIKVRSSAPDTVSPANRWNFLRKVISLKRAQHQQVYIAGDASGTRKWGVDDQLIINGKVFNGLVANYTGKNGLLPSKVQCLPLEITNLIPPDKETRLRMELADHGQFWGNTDIYIIVKN
jgi:hypothetical protein